MMPTAPPHAVSAQLMLPVLNRAAFLEKMFDSTSNDRGGIFVAGDLDVKLGEEVELELHFMEEAVRFRLRAQVLWKRPTSGRHGLEGGTGLGFATASKKTKERLLAFVDGMDIYHRPRDNRRYPVHVDVRLDTGGGVINAITEDLSEGGCFVLMAEPPPLGTRVAIKFRAENSLFGWLTIQGVVSWQRFEAMRTGAGFEFRFDSDSKRKKMEKLLMVMRERALRVIAPRV
jgi:Tfp pilus assembly protein PilZ